MTVDGIHEHHLLSSYPHPSPSRYAKYWPPCKLWEACAATMATVGFFDLVKVSRTTGFCPPIVWDTPLRYVWHEVIDQWTPRDRETVLINIGSGLIFKEVTGRKVDTFLDKPSRPIKVFRFNGNRAVNDWTLKEDVFRFPEISEYARQYMASEEFADLYNPCTQKLGESFNMDNGQP